MATTRGDMITKSTVYACSERHGVCAEDIL